MAGPITGKFAADFTGFIAAVEKATIKLVDMNKGAAGVEQRLNTMTEKFSGRSLIQQASLMTIAVEQVGGVSKLTASELDRVGRIAAEAAEKMKKLGYEVPPGLQKIADTTKAVGKETETASFSVTKFVEGYLTANAILGVAKGAWSAITGQISASITAAGDAEKAHVQLVAALRAQGTAIPSVVNAYSAYATALQRTTIYQDDAIEGAAALLVQVGDVMPRDMEKALKATTDLASGLGKDLTSATLLVAKAAEGNTAALKKAGIVIDETKAKSEGFGYVLDQIEQKFRGQAEAIAGTYQGRLAQLANTWNNVQESIGRVVTENATVLAFFDNLNGAIDQNTGELKDNATMMGLVRAVIVGVQAFSLFIDGLNLLQVTASATINGLRIVAQTIGNIGIAAAQTGQYLALARGDLAGYNAGAAAVEKLKEAVTELGNRNEQTAEQSRIWYNALDAVGHKADDLAKRLAVTRGEVKAFSPTLDGAANSWNRFTTAATKGGKGTEDAAKAHEKLVQKLRELEIVVPGVSGAVTKLTDDVSKDVEAAEKARAAHEKLAAELDQIERSSWSANFGMQGLATGIDKVGMVALASDEYLTVFGDGIGNLHKKTQSFTDFLSKDFSQAIQRAFEGGGNVLKSLGGSLGGFALNGSEAGSALGQKITDGLKSKLGDKLGGVLGSILPGIGTVLGGLAGSLFGKLFDNPEKQINPIRQAFVDAAGGLDALNQKAVAAGTSLTAMLNAKNPEQYKAAIDALNAALEKQATTITKAFTDADAAAQAFGAHVPAAFAPLIQQLLTIGGLTDAQRTSLQGLLGATDTDLKHVTDTAAKYGLQLDDLGSKTQQLSISGRADEIVSDFGELVDAGAEYGNTVNHFAGQINLLIQNAKTYGSSLPTALQPIAQALLNSGQLTDATGQKLEDLSDITFDDTSDPLAKSMQSLQDALNHLADVLEKLPGKAEAAASGISGAFAGVSVEVPVNFRVGDVPSLGYGGEAIAAASGYEGTVTRPTLFLAGEAGPERVSIGSGGGSSAWQSLAAEMRSLRDDMPRMFRDAILLMG